MRESNSSTIALPAVSSKDVLTTILRDGAQRMLAQAIEAEVSEWIDGHAHLTNEKGHRQVVRNGHLPQRTITTGVGPVEVAERSGAVVPERAVNPPAAAPRAAGSPTQTVR